MARTRLSSPMRRLLLRMFGFVVLSSICGVLVAAYLVPQLALAGTTVTRSLTYFNSLPSELAVEPPAQTTKMLTADGKTIATFFAENRVQIPLREMSPYIKDAVVAIEDSRFYGHGGIDPLGLLRALTTNITEGERQGASTITQQYVTNVANEARISAGREEQVILSGQKNIGDKLREMRLAIELEKKFTKERILEGYLNIVFFNRNAYGIEAAAQYYYSIPASKLNLPQAALLAGLVNSPSVYDPVTSPENSIQRRNQVLGAMLEQGKITQKKHDDAVAADVGLRSGPPKQGCAAAVMAPYFCDYAAT